MQGDTPILQLPPGAAAAAGAQGPRSPRQHSDSPRRPVPTSPGPAAGHLEAGPDAASPRLFSPNAAESLRTENSSAAASPPRTGHRLIVVSNRLPITLAETKQGDFDIRKSSGGLVAALAGLTGRVEMVWLGSPGLPPERFTDPERADLTRRLLAEHQCMPVWIDKQTAHEHYNLFSNEVLWPLFHYKENIQFKDAKIFQSYVRANKAFCDAVISVCQEGDLVWVHDYHLMVLPKLLREEMKLREMPATAIAFFLHVPFPTSEVYRILPEAEEILSGVLNADLIGFHTYDYARYFVHTCTRVLGIEHTANEVVYDGRAVTVGVFPVGMDFEKFQQMLVTPEVRAKVQELRRRFEGQTVIIGVDRLDYVKGIPQKLAALERLFQMDQRLIGQLVLIQIAVPSREDVEEYQMLRREVETLVGHINTNYGDIGVSPVTYLCKSVPFLDLLAMYSVADICLVTSLRDGMNLVAQEFIACQEENKGVLVLSEFAGAARCLASALRVNPWNVKNVAEALERAVHMEREERERRHSQLFKYVGAHAANYWGTTFVEEFARVADKLRGDQAEPIPNLIEAYRQAERRLVVVAVDGVLCDWRSPVAEGVSRRALQALGSLAADSANDVVVLGSQTGAELDAVFGDIPGLTLAAESGCFWRVTTPRQGSASPLEWERLDIRLGDDDWYQQALDTLVRCRDRTPGSSVHGRAEGRKQTLLWSYRHADPDFGAMQVSELQLHLSSRATTPFIVEHCQQRKCLECRPKGLTPDRVIEGLARRLAARAVAAGSVADSQQFDLAVYFGSDCSEGDVQSHHIRQMITCGGSKQLRRPGRTRFCLRSQQELVPLLRTLAGLPPEPDSPDAAARTRRRAQTLSESPASPRDRIRHSAALRDMHTGISHRRASAPVLKVHRDVGPPENFVLFY